MDAYGMALDAFLRGKKDASLTVESEEMETEEWPVAQFFRSYDEMDSYEHVALDLCCGKVLDVGAGAGSHSLILQEKGIDVTALDCSEKACDVMRRRGVKNVLNGDFFTMETTQRYDTLLFMMNGLGLCETLERLTLFVSRCSELLNVGGQALMDSSDLIYLYEDENGETWLPMNANYYGEVHYAMSYGKTKGEPFGWLFVGYDVLSDIATKAGLSCELLQEDENDHYLARLVRRS